MTAQPPGPGAAPVEAARASAAAGRLEEALELLRPVVAAEPLHADALPLFAQVAAQLGRIAEVQELADRVVALQDNHPGLFHLAGRLLIAAGRNDLALPYLLGGAGLGSGDGALFADTARGLAGAGRIEEAGGYARQSIALDATSEMEALAARSVRPAVRGRSSGESLKVAVVTAWPVPREHKLGAAIRAAGGEATLLAGSAATFDANQAFDRVLSFRSPMEALAMARELDIDVFHVVAHMNYDLALAFVAHRPAAVVVDSYDLMTGMWTEAFFARNPHHDAARRVERFCLEEADGSCVRSLQPQTAKRAHGFRFARPLIFWPDYAWGQRPGGAKLSAADGNLHVLFSGNVNEGDNPYDWLVELLDGLGIHFHFYPLGGPPDAAGFRQRFAKYFELEAKHAHFHVHEPVAGERWLETMSRYDVLVSFSNVLFSGRPGAVWTVAKTQQAMTNKLFECLDTDLLFLSHRGKFVSRIAERYGFGLGLSKEQAKSPEWWEGLRERVLGAGAGRSMSVPALSVGRQAPRLMAFYRTAMERVARSGVRPG